MRISVWSSDVCSSDLSRKHRMKLYYSPSSPYVRKVSIVALETGLDGRIERIPAATTPVAPNEAVATANPLAKVPTLVTDAGEMLFDSRVICEYLDSLHPGPQIGRTQCRERRGEKVEK